jgi:uncharacterized membrane protein YdjX (TVP38/TMEM64 family)
MSLAANDAKWVHYGFPAQQISYSSWGWRQMKTKQQKISIKAIIFLSLVAAILLLAYYGPQPFSVLGALGERLGKFYTTKESFSQFLISLGSYSPIFFVLLQGLQVVISPIPGELTGIVGGYIYGATLGFILSTLGLTLGSWAAFELARILGRPFVEKFVSEDLLKKFEFLTTDTGVTICFLLFLIPGFPKDVLCYLLGLSRMRRSTFLVLSTLGRMPGTFLLTMQGASLRNEQYHTAVAIAATSVAIVFIAYLCRAQLYQWLRGLSRIDVRY